MFKKILVATDGSDSAIKAVAVACGLAKQYGSKDQPAFRALQEAASRTSVLALDPEVVVAVDLSEREPIQ